LNEVAKRIASEIAVHGAISFAQFMELALYCPIFGYYEKKKDNPGRHGDFFTSVSVGPLFGELLGYQFAEWIEQFQVQQEESVHILEAGAHDGRLAKDILTWMRQSRPGLYERLEYWIVEPSLRRQQWQQAMLEDFPEKVAWTASLQQLRKGAKTSGVAPILGVPESGVRGIIFSNELLDSMPVQRWGWDARKREWFEWGVGMDERRFVWTRLKPSTVHGPQPGVPADLLPFLADGFVREIGAGAQEWWRSAAGLLQCGKLLTFDYGLTEEELLRPERSQGTLRAYKSHSISHDVLAAPGEQDLTAHVDFTAIQRAGESAGLRTAQIIFQEQFLMGILSQAEKNGVAIGNGPAERKRQFQTLTSPEHFGRLRVLLQEPG